MNTVQLERSDKMLIGLIKEIMENSRVGGDKLSLQYIDYSKSYPHICNVQVLTLPPGMMAIVYWEETKVKTA